MNYNPEVAGIKMKGFQPCVEFGRRDLAEALAPAAQTLAAAVLAAVRAVPEETFHRVARLDAGVAFQPKPLLALLTYCYAIGVYASHDIEGFMCRDENFRRICANEFPDALTLRRFRRLNRETIIRCLAQVLEHSQDPATSKSISLFERQDVADPDYYAEAQSRVETAILLDLDD